MHSIYFLANKLWFESLGLVQLYGEQAKLIISVWRKHHYTFWPREMFGLKVQEAKMHSYYLQNNSNFQAH